MKKFVKLLCLLLAACFCFSVIAGCVKNPPDDSGNGGDNTTPPDNGTWEEAEGDYVYSNSQPYSTDYKEYLDVEHENLVLSDVTTTSGGRFARKNSNYISSAILPSGDKNINAHNFNGSMFDITGLTVPKARLKFTLCLQVSQTVFDSTFSSAGIRVDPAVIGEMRIYKVVDGEEQTAIQIPITTDDYKKKNAFVETVFYAENAENLENATFSLINFCHYSVTFKFQWVYIEAVGEEEFTASYKVKDVLTTDAMIPEAERETRAEALTYEDDVLYIFDYYNYLPMFRSTKDQYDIGYIIPVIQGLANRNGDHLYILAQGTVYINTLSDDVDNTYLEYLTSEGEYFNGKTLKYLYNFDEIMQVFGNLLEGLIVWDENVPATSNTVMGACSTENLIPVRFNSSPDSLMNVLRENYELKVKYNLNGKFTGEGIVWGTEEQSSGSSKVDAYIWSYNNYLAAGKLDPRHLAIYMDAFSSDYEQRGVSYHEMNESRLYGRDYYISKCGYIFDLDPYPDSKPNDDPDQPMISAPELNQTKDGMVTADYWMYSRILKYCNNALNGEEPIRVGGYVPFAYKYAKRSNDYGLEPGDVYLENATSFMLGWYNAYLLVESPVPNTSMLSRVEFSEQTIKNTGDKEAFKTKTLENKNYVCFYMGDYDSSGWVSNYLMQFVKYGRRVGEVPVALTMMPGLMEKVPYAYNYIMKMLYELPQEKRDNIYWICGDNGYGYSNYIEMDFENRPDGLMGSFASATEYTATFLSKFGVTINGFLLFHQRLTPAMEQALAKAYPDGYAVLSHNIRYNRLVFGEGINENGVPVFWPNKGYSHNGMGIDKDSDLKNMGLVEKEILQTEGRPNFIFIRAVLVDIDDAARANDALKKSTVYEGEIVDPYTFFEMYRQAVKGGYSYGVDVKHSDAEY